MIVKRIAALCIMFTLIGTANYAWAVSLPASQQLNIIDHVIIGIQDVSKEARALREQIDQSLNRIGSSDLDIEKSTRDWQALLSGLKSRVSEIKRMTEMIHVDVLTAEKDDPYVAEALRQYDNLGQDMYDMQAQVEAAENSLREFQRRAARIEKAVKPINLTGVWIEKGRNKRWQVRHDPETGNITILEPVGQVAGLFPRYAEYNGSVSGKVITATCRLSDPDLLNRKLPLKVRLEHIRTNPEWTLNLRIKNSDSLSGEKHGEIISYSKSTQKITEVNPAIKEVLLERR